MISKHTKTIWTVWKIFKATFSDYLFPKFCAGCGKEGDFLCSNCSKDILFVQTQVCPQCGKISAQGKFCLKCRRKEKKYLMGIIASCYYEEGPIKEAVHNFKYNSLTELASFLARPMTTALLQNINHKDKLLTFTPLHSKRLVERGYNQSELLANEISKNLDIGVVRCLKKIKHTKRQVELIGKSRRKNLSGVFEVININKIKGRKIIVVDDIATTGTTLNECARVLRDAGAKEVWGLVVARG